MLTSTTYSKTLSVDIETYSSADLGKVGVYKYAQSPDFDVLLFGYAYDDGPVMLVDLTKDKLPKFLWQDLLDATVLKTAFNAQFERVCLDAYLGIMTWPWDCTMIRAWELGFSGGLKAVGEAVGVEEEARKINGSKLITTFCKPRKPTKNNPSTRWRPEDKPEEWQAFCEYNVRDVEAERAIRQKLLAYPILASEVALYRLDQEINDRGVLIDTEMCKAAIKISDDLVGRSQARYLALTGLSNVNSLVQLKSWLKETTGDVVGSVTKEALPVLMEKYKELPDVVEVLRLRALLGKTSVAKYQKMLDTACADHRSRGNTQFFGARTGRWAGRLIQLQNLPQNHLNDLDTAREVVAFGDSEVAELIYDDVTDLLRQCIRTAIVPPDGKKFVVADFSAIEARVIAWLAGEQWRLDVFKDGGDIYCASASQMFGVPVVKHGVNGHLRQKGKVAELALGYAGSVGALKAMGALKMGIAEEELKPIVEKWRKASPNVVKLWHLIEDACAACIQSRQPKHINSFLSVLWEGDIMFIVLPSGRRLGYVKPKLSMDEYGRSRIHFEDGDKVTETYYGKLTENVVQATARDCLAQAMLKLDKQGYKIIMHVHDEVIVEVDKDKDALDEVCSIMGEPISWAPGLPLRADGYECSYYKKD